MKEIQLTQGQIALVDDEDFDSLNQYKWYAMKDGNTFYAARNIEVDGKRTIVRMHYSIMNGKGIDHIDGNGCNNLHSNLRLCTHNQNMMNKRKQKNTTSIYKGVCFHKRADKWVAHIMITRTLIYLGLFASEIDAAKAYNTKAIELFGEFANLNNIN